MSLIDSNRRIVYRNYLRRLKASALPLLIGLASISAGPIALCQTPPKPNSSQALAVRQPVIDSGTMAATGLPNRVGQPNIDGAEAPDQSRADLSHRFVSVLPLRINDTARFSVLSLVNNGDQVQSFLVQAHDQNGRREQRSFRLKAGERRESIVARLFPRLNDYSLRLLQTGDAIAMALDTWPIFAGNAKIPAVVADDISYAQRLTFAPGDEDAVFSFGALFEPGHPAEASRVDVTLWHGDVPIGSAELVLEDERRVEMGFAELFPGVDIEGPYFLCAKSRERHRLSCSIRNTDGIATGLSDVAVTSPEVLLKPKSATVYSSAAPD